MFAMIVNLSLSSKDIAENTFKQNMCTLQVQQETKQHLQGNWKKKAYHSPRDQVSITLKR